MIRKLIAVYDTQQFDKVYTTSSFVNCFKIILLLNSIQNVNIPAAFQTKIMTACFFPCEAHALSK